mgnify:FL=1
MKITVDTILEYVDEPQLFIARDDFGTMYLCLLYDDSRYTAIRISSSRLKEFEAKRVDLLTLFREPEKGGEYFDVSVCGDDLQLLPLAELDDSRRPSAGYYLSAPAHERVTITIPVQDKSLLSSLAKKFGWVAM